MARQKKKAKQQSCKKEATNTPSSVPWPNLPRQLVGVIASQPSLMQNITSFGCVTKSWRATSRCCLPQKDTFPWPQLIEINGNECQKSTRSRVVEIPFNDHFYVFRGKRRCRERWTCFKGYSHELLVAAQSDSTEWLLWHPIKRWYSRLPPWNRNIPFKLATLSSSAYHHFRINHPCNIMVITGNCRPSFAFHRWAKGEMEWIVQDCTLPDPCAPGPSQYMNFTNAIGFQDKFYALSLQGSLAVIEDVDSCFKITAIGANRAVPSKVSRQFREYLMESNGKILLVFLISRKSIDVIDDVEVFRLDIPKLTWVKVESLGDTTLFLEDECCMAVDAKRVGCKKNCIYFTNWRVDNWLIYDIETSRISLVRGESRESLMWDEPWKDDENEFFYFYRRYRTRNDFKYLKMV